MPLTIASDEVDQLAEKLASRTGVSKAEAVRVALVNETGTNKASRWRSGCGPCSTELADPSHRPRGRQGFYDSLNDE